MEVNRDRKKGGRPQKTASEKRTCPIKLSTTPREFERLKGLADQRKQPVANLVRDLYQEGVVVVITPEQERMLMQLAGMANNLNQLSRLAHREGLSGAAVELSKLTTHLNTILDQWSLK